MTTQDFGDFRCHSLEWRLHRDGRERTAELFCRGAFEFEVRYSTDNVIDLVMPFKGPEAAIDAALHARTRERRLRAEGWGDNR